MNALKTLSLSLIALALVDIAPASAATGTPANPADNLTVEVVDNSADTSEAPTARWIPQAPIYVPECEPIVRTDCGFNPWGYYECRQVIVGERCF